MDAKKIPRSSEKNESTVPQAKKAKHQQNEPEVSAATEEKKSNPNRQHHLSKSETPATEDVMAATNKGKQKMTTELAARVAKLNDKKSCKRSRREDSFVVPTDLRRDALQL